MAWPASKALDASATGWFLMAAAGQWMFAFYIIVTLMRGLASGELMHDMFFATHMMLAAIITIAGPLQLVPQIRSRFPVFHHWNGRAYLFNVFVMSVGALYMTWNRDSLTGQVGQVGFSINAALIIAFAVMALRNARACRIQNHRRWALRLFITVSGVWFFRVGLMAWIMLNGGPVGFDPETLQGPFITFMIFGQYLVPLIVLEIYLRTQAAANAAGRIAMAVGLLILTIVMVIGIFGATMGMWLPRL